MNPGMFGLPSPGALGSGSRLQRIRGRNSIFTGPQDAPPGVEQLLLGTTWPANINTLRTLLTVQGSGILKLVALQDSVASLSQCRLRLTIDNIVVYDYTNSSSNKKLFVPIGSTVRTTNEATTAVTNWVMDAVPYTSGFVIEASTDTALASSAFYGYCVWEEWR